MTDLVLMVAGQSNGTQMCVVPVAGCEPIAGCNIWNPNTTWRPMTSDDGAGIVELARMLKTQTGRDVYVYNCTYGGSTVVPAACDPNHPNNHWHSFAQDSPLSGAMVQVSAGGKLPEFIIWIEGEQAGAYAAINPSYDMVTNWKSYTDQLRNYMHGQWSIDSSQCTWMILPVGAPNYGNTKYVLQSQILYFNGTAGVIPGPGRYDLATIDSVHMNGPSCRTLGDRIAQALLNKLGVNGFVNCGPGPQLTGAWKDQAHVEIHTNSTTGIVAKPGCSMLSGFQVYNYWWQPIGISSAYVSSGYIMLELASNPGNGNHIRILYQADNGQSGLWPPLDQQQVFLNEGDPLLPCYHLESGN